MKNYLIDLSGNNSFIAMSVTSLMITYTYIFEDYQLFEEHYFAIVCGLWFGMAIAGAGNQVKSVGGKPCRKKNDGEN